MNPLEQQVLDAIDFEGMISFLARLIAVPSMNGNESEAQRRVADQMNACGLQVDMWEIDLEQLARHPAHGQEVTRSEALGVVGQCGSESGAHSLILNGHVDVVPAGDESRWQYPPWKATLTDRRVYGRGSADMKGGLSCALFAAKAIRDAGIELASPLQIQSVVGEEDGGCGTLGTLQRGHQASAAIIMEPTNLEIVTAQAGALSFRLTVPGKTAHASMRSEGTSALEKFIPLHRAIEELEQDRNTGTDHPLMAEYELPYPISIGTIRAGNWASSVPEQLVCEGRFGVAIGESVAEAKMDFEKAIHESAGRDSWLMANPPTVEWWGGQFESAEISTDHPLIHTLQQVAVDIIGHPSRIRGVTYGADMRLLVNEGQIQTIMYGPGNVRVAHQTDEYVPLDDLLIGVRTLALAVLRYCGCNTAPKGV